MLIINELRVNLCDFKGTVCEQNFRRKWTEVQKQAEAISGKEVDGAYFGFEFCANMLAQVQFDDVLKHIHFIKEQGLDVTWVLPPLHERYIDRYKDFLEKLFTKAQIDECVVNDIGALCMLRKEIGWTKKINLGRMFDKSVREMRFDVCRDIKLREQKEIFLKPGVYSEMMLKLAEEYQVGMFETDTLPNDILRTEKWGDAWEIGIHYPRIYLSRPAYCEYEGVGMGKDKKFLFETLCNGNCRIYEKEIRAEGKPAIRKTGLSVIGYQQRQIKEAVTGKIRMIYSR